MFMRAMTISAKHEKGVFRPFEEVEVKDGTVVEVNIHNGNAPAPKRQSIKELPYFGMWADREDITGGVSYVNSLRNNPRG